MMDVDTIKNR